MPKYRMLSVDLDGTLLTSDRTLPPRCVDAVGRCREAGVHVLLCTARPPRSTRVFYDALGLDTELIAYNGAMIVHPPTAAVLRDVSMPPALAQRVLGLVLAAEPEAVVTFEKRDEWHTDPRGADIVTATGDAGFTPDVVCDLWECVATPVTKMLVSKDPEALRRIEAALLQEGRDQITVTKCDDYLLQIGPAGASKAAALRECLRSRGLAPADLAAIGDAENDLPMFELAGLSMAVANAAESVKARASVVVPSNDEEGVVVAIERHVL